MSSGLSVALPLTLSDVFGAYNLNTNFAQLATQNLKMLILTNPGERMMDPEFGVGIRNFLFQQNTPDTYGNITTAIQRQVQKYLPYISIDNVQYSIPENNPDLFPNSLSVIIKFTIVPLQQSAVLQIQQNQPI
jgi:hypothetical protein|tara:strand:+ start:483 stop:881 length:399 start_codon:yes stop_codon:yes gene_type:complete